MTAAERELLDLLTKPLLLAASRLSNAAASPGELDNLLVRSGWRLPYADTPNLAAFASSIDLASVALPDVQAFLAGTMTVQDAMAEILPAFAHWIEALGDIDLAEDTGLVVAPETARALVRDLAEQVVLDALLQAFPELVGIGIMLKLVHHAPASILWLSGGSEPADSGDIVVRMPMTRPAFDSARLAQLAERPAVMIAGILAEASGPSGRSTDLAAVASRVIQRELGQMLADLRDDSRLMIDPLGLAFSLPGIELSDVALFPVHLPLPGGQLFTLKVGAVGGLLRVEWPVLAGADDGALALIDLDFAHLDLLAGAGETGLEIAMADGEARLAISCRAELTLKELPGTGILGVQGGIRLVWSASGGASLELQQFTLTGQDIALGDSALVLREAELVLGAMTLPAGRLPHIDDCSIRASGLLAMGEAVEGQAELALDEGVWTVTGSGEIRLSNGLTVHPLADEPVLRGMIDPRSDRASLRIAGGCDFPLASGTARIEVAGDLVLESGAITGSLAGTARDWPVAADIMADRLALKAGWDERTCWASIGADIRLGEGLALHVLDDATPTGQKRGLVLSRTPDGTHLQAVLTGGIGVDLPTDAISADNGATVTIAGFGELRLSSDPAVLPQLANVDLELEAQHLQIGSGTGLALEQAKIGLHRVDRLFARPFAAPFAEAVLRDIKVRVDASADAQVAMRIEQARLIFADADELPRFALDDASAVTVETVLPPSVPMQMDRARITFTQGCPPRTVRTLFEPDNVTITFDARFVASAGRFADIGGSLEGVTARLVGGRPQLTVNGATLGVRDLELGVASFSGKLGVHNLLRPERLQLEGLIGGKVYGSGVKAFVALHSPDGVLEPLGVCLDASAGPGGIVLPYGFMITGASGGISFANSNGNPCDFRSYAPHNAGEVLQAGKPSSTRRPAKFDGCECCNCPPDSMNVLCQPHPDQRSCQGRVILKFSALEETQWAPLPFPGGGTVGDWVRARDRELSAASAPVGAALEARLADLSNRALDAVAVLMATRMQPLGAAAQPPLLQTTSDRVLEAVRQPVAAWLQDARAQLLVELRKAVTRSTEPGRFYEAVKTTLYRGVTCRDETLQVTGTMSHAAVTAFLSVTGGVCVSTAGAIGVVGRLNLFSVPLGQLNAFLIGTDASGNPEPSLCGDLALEVGPVSFGQVGVSLTCPGLVTTSAALLAQFFKDLPAPLLKRGIDMISPEPAAGSIQSRAGFDLDANPQASLALLSTEEATGLIAQLGAMAGPALPAVTEACAGLAAHIWQTFHPELRFCGAATVRLFGITLGELARVEGRSTKDHFSAEASFSPAYVLGRFSPIADMFSGMDRAKLGVAMSILPPEDLAAAALMNQVNSPETLEAFLDAGLERILRQSSFTLSYEFFPLGMSLTHGVGRVILPYLTPHPAHAASGWTNPDTRTGYPDRLSVLYAALDKGALESVAWQGDLGSVLPAASPAANASLQRDYFPHGGIVGVGRINVPALLAKTPPRDLLNQAATGEPLQRAKALLALVKDYLMASQPSVTLAFYAPFPSPPAAMRAAPAPGEEAGHARRVVDEMQRKGLDAIGLLSPDYPADLAFLEGSFTGLLLGIELARARVLWQPPSPSAPAGTLRISAAVNAQSWLRMVCDVAMLDFILSLAPDMAALDRRARATVQAAFTEIAAMPAPNTTDAAERIIAGFNSAAKAVPRVRLVTEAGVFTPAEWRPAITFAAGARCRIEACSPFYDRTAGTTDPAGQIRHTGGMTVTASFQLAIAAWWKTSVVGTLHLAPPDGNTKAPRLSGQVNLPGVQHLALPGLAVVCNSATVRVNTAAAEGAAVVALLATLEAASQTPGSIGFAPWAGGRIALECAAIRKSGKLEPRATISPFRVTLPCIDPATAVVVCGKGSSPANPREVEVAADRIEAVVMAPAGLQLRDPVGQPFLAVIGEQQGRFVAESGKTAELTISLRKGSELVLLSAVPAVRQVLRLVQAATLSVRIDGTFSLELEAEPLVLAGDFHLHGQNAPTSPVSLVIDQLGLRLRQPAVVRLKLPGCAETAASITNCSWGREGWRIGARGLGIPLPATGSKLLPRLTADLDLQIGLQGARARLAVRVEIADRAWPPQSAVLLPDRKLTLIWDRSFVLLRESPATQGVALDANGGGSLSVDYALGTVSLRLARVLLSVRDPAWPTLQHDCGASTLEWRDGTLRAVTFVVDRAANMSGKLDVGDFTMTVKSARLDLKLDIKGPDTAMRASLSGGKIEFESRLEVLGKRFSFTESLGTLPIANGKVTIKIKSRAAPASPPGMPKFPRFPEFEKSLKLRDFLIFV